MNAERLARMILNRLLRRGMRKLTEGQRGKNLPDIRGQAQRMQMARRLGRMIGKL